MTPLPDPASADPEPSLAELYDDSPVGLISIDPRDVIVKVNATMLRWLGLAEADLLGTTFRDRLTIGSMLFYDTRFQPVLSLGGEVSEVSLSMRVSDGSTLPVLVNARSVPDAAGEVRIVRLAILDSTSRQGYERELLLARRAAESSEARVRVLQDASIAFGASIDETGLAVSLMESARKAVSAGAAAVLLCDADKRLVPVDGSHPLAAELAGLPGSPVDRAISELLPSSLENARRPAPGDEPTGLALLAARFEAVTVVPLAGETETIGVLVTFFGRARAVVPELIGLEQALGRQAVEVITRIRLQAELQRLALQDGLTGLANRTMLLYELGIALAGAMTTGGRVAVVFLDLDGFKAVNDDLGHYAGDEVLRCVATRLSKVARPSDVVARFGGDEFVVVCPGLDHSAALATAQAMVAAIAEPIDHLPDRFAITASTGLAVCDPRAAPQLTAQSVLMAADEAMYRSKQTTRGSISVVAI